jgi:hypothetical protein
LKKQSSSSWGIFLRLLAMRSSKIVGYEEELQKKHPNSKLATDKLVVGWRDSRRPKSNASKKLVNLIGLQFSSFFAWTIEMLL